ncbi:peptidase C39 family protein [Streptomyces sp. MI02-7b]|uniref:peptidase C39 family protein n=1 Tax=Streptomyces sp. MI02-7b TaxID=462941 RepID=UPI0029A1384F|nr:peptidase C39 family protein [Streptomyces sp. MI02-7b]MDX3071569.1 peptidase C39 family protein [Streptomyces sp. MI02-7b]
MTRPAPRRTMLVGALVAATAAATPRALAATGGDRRPCEPGPSGGRPGRHPYGDHDEASVDHHAWTRWSDWHSGDGSGTCVEPGPRPGIAIGRPSGVLEYADPHTGITETWETATWTSPVHTPRSPATEIVASWNARTPADTWIQVELCATYTDGSMTPWYVMGRWASGDADIRRTSVDGQTDAKSSVSTDTLAIDDPASGVRLAWYRLRLTLLRRPGSDATPTVWRVGAMASDIPDRFTVPPSGPGVARGIELPVPRYSQEIHKGQYPEYDNGGEAWCSPTSSQMVIEYWGRGPDEDDLAWVDPSYEDPQVDHAARSTYDYQYEGCGNWPFNTAYTATYRDLVATVTRLHGLHDVERLIRAGIPVMTSQSFLATELDGAGYGTSGHLMCVIGFTPEGDVVVNDPASRDDEAVRRVYRREQFETNWLRTKRYAADGQVRSGTGGVCYLSWPLWPSPAQSRVLHRIGVL